MSILPQDIPPDIRTAVEEGRPIISVLFSCPKSLRHVSKRGDDRPIPKSYRREFLRCRWLVMLGARRELGSVLIPHQLGDVPPGDDLFVWLTLGIPTDDDLRTLCADLATYYGDLFADPRTRNFLRMFDAVVEPPMALLEVLVPQEIEGAVALMDLVEFDLAAPLKKMH